MWHTSQGETQGTQCSTLVSIYLDKYKRSLFSSVQHCYVFFGNFVWKKKTKNCQAPQFSKITFIVFIFDGFLCQKRFLQGLQWVLMGFSVCSVRFLVGSGGFLLWFIRKRNTLTCMRNIATEWVTKFFCVCKFDCKSFLSAFGLKNRKCYLRRWQWKRKEILRLLLNTRRILDTGCWFTLGKVRSWKVCFEKCLLLLKMLFNFLPSPA